MFLAPHEMQDDSQLISLLLDELLVFLKQVLDWTLAEQVCEVDDVREGDARKSIVGSEIF